MKTIWQLECDGAYQRDGAGASTVLTAPSGTQLKYAVRLDFKGCTNNVAEYEGLLLGLRKARALSARRLSIRSDSELITGHINKSNRALKPELAKYLAAVRSMEKYFLGISIRSFSRTKYKKADQLAKAAAQFDPLPPDVFFETLK
jgi:ribonuclease HI